MDAVQKLDENRALFLGVAVVVGRVSKSKLVAELDPVFFHQNCKALDCSIEGV